MPFAAIALFAYLVEFGYPQQLEIHAQQPANHDQDKQAHRQQAERGRHSGLIESDAADHPGKAQQDDSNSNGFWNFAIGKMD